MGERKELPIPPSVLASERSVEILRVWINADQSMDTTLIPSFYETAYWGVLLVDLTHRVAEAYAEQTGLPKADVVESIRSVYTSHFDERAKTLSAAASKTKK
jgi:hypothetical protein